MTSAQLELFPNTSKQEIIHSDCLEVMRGMAENSIDFIVTDPPYGLCFMNKKWDAEIPGQEIWSEALRICKPGAMLAAFGGSRTHHHLMMSLELAGWEIRDVIMWIYGSGFPKSLDVSKSIDKRGGNPALVDEVSKEIKKERESRNLSVKECDDKFCGGTTNWSWFEGRPAGKRLPSDETFKNICNEWPNLYKYFNKVKDVNREIVPTTGNLHKGTGNTIGCFTGTQKSNIPITKLSETFSGYGTALKPSFEPIILAMKPLDCTFAQNAEKWGVAGINIDASRIGTEEKLVRPFIERYNNNVLGKGLGAGIQSEPRGRWPSNLILDEQSVAELDQMTGNNVSRFFYCAKSSSAERNRGLEGLPLKETGIKNDSGIGFSEHDPYAKRMAYNNHPTVKPIALMKYILKLLAPPGNPVCLDPFAGSGSTLVAAKDLGFSCLGIEKEAEYCEIARKRIEGA